jgi:hypothetical protein
LVEIFQITAEKNTIKAIMIKSRFAVELTISIEYIASAVNANLILIDLSSGPKLGCIYTVLEFKIVL